jgi:hypothetical protein
LQQGAIHTTLQPQGRWPASEVNDGGFPEKPGHITPGALRPFVVPKNLSGSPLACSLLG